MGVDITMTVPHNVADVSVEIVAAKFRPLGDLFDELQGRYPDSYRTWRDVSDPEYGRPYLFYAPAGFTLSFGPRLLRIHHVTRFRSFCVEDDLRQLLRRFTYGVLGLMNGDRAIYSPDQGIGDQIYDLIFDGISFDDLESHLLKLGVPATSFAELEERWAPQPRYYVDRFEDFIGSARGEGDR
ncbi:MAG TPA: hypothetical protein VGJ73_03525 [Verrucomicrobiae bacterium]|jgi:hypothetical protein